MFVPLKINLNLLDKKDHLFDQNNLDLLDYHFENIDILKMKERTLFLEIITYMPKIL